MSKSFVDGNQVVALRNGEAAYPVMLEAIETAQVSVALATYMFADDPVGVLFVSALGRAVSRGVDVRLIVDCFGALLSWPPIQIRLKQYRVPYCGFSPLWRAHRFGNRYHRKLLIIDGAYGFAGGMNIRQHHLVSEFTSCPTADLQFRIAGPVVTRMQETFAKDWLEATGESLAGERWFPPLARSGTALVRTIASGPGSADTFRASVMSALAQARYDVSIVTPYFFPDRDPIDQIKASCLRGVKVEIMIPQDTWVIFKWASARVLKTLLETGCMIILTAPPFEHSKIVLVDKTLALIGSSNWDNLSWQSNYEFDLEVHDPALLFSIGEIVLAKRARAEEVRETLIAPTIKERVRNRVASLLLPFL